MKMSLQLKLKDSAVEILVGLLQPKEMIALYMLGTGETESKKFNNVDLIKIIIVLCEELRWTQEEKVDRDTPSENNELSDVGLIKTVDCYIKSKGAISIHKVQPGSAKKWPVISRSLEETRKTEFQASQKPEQSKDSSDVINQTEVKACNTQDICVAANKLANEIIPSNGEQNVFNEAIESIKVEPDLSVVSKDLPSLKKTSCQEKIKYKPLPQFDEQLTDTILDKHEAAFNCFLCDQMFKGFSALEEHEKEHKRELFRCFQCSVCNNSFISQAKLKAHEKLHVENNNKQQKSTRSKNQGPFSCSFIQCNKQFMKKSSLRTHEKTHIDKSAWHSCFMCYKKFQHFNELRVVNSVNELYSCRKCDNILLGPKHSPPSTKLTKELPFTCSKCNKQFSGKNLLELHERYMCTKKFKVDNS